MSKMKLWFQDDMSGGENSLVPPDRIGENQLVEMKNMLPRWTDTGIHPRTAFSSFMDVGSHVYRVFTKRKTDGTVSTFIVKRDGDDVVVYDFGQSIEGDVVFEPVSVLDPSSQTPPEFIEYNQDGSISWSENWSYDYWVEDGADSDWDGTGVWTDFTSADAAYFIMNIVTPDRDCSITMNFSEHPSREFGRCAVYVWDYALEDWEEVDLVEEPTPLTVEFMSGSNTTKKFKVVVLDGTGDTGGRLSNIVIRYSTDGDIIHTYEDEIDFGTVWFVDWDGDRILFSDGNNGLWVYDFDESATRVEDKSNPTPEANAPSGRYLIQHKGRLFMATESGNGSLSTVAVSGASDSVNKRYESWSGLGASDGGSVDVTPYGTNIVGLAASYEGVLVFKERSIHLWSYPDSSAPWNPLDGAQIDVIFDGLGAVDHDCIVSTETGVYFIGKSDRRKVGLWVVNDGSVSSLSDSVPELLRKAILDGSTRVFAEVFDSFYLVAGFDAQSGETRVFAVYDIESGAWSSFTSPTLTCCHKSINGEYIIYGDSEGRLFKYPSGVYIDDDGSNIEFTIRTRLHQDSSPSNDVYYRMVRIGGGASRPTDAFVRLIGNSGEAYDVGRVVLRSEGTDYWEDDGSTWDSDDGTYWGIQFDLDEYMSEADFRIRGGAQLEITGRAVSDAWLNYLALGFRPRRVRNHKDA